MMQYSKPYSFEKTDVRGQKLKNIAPNVKNMKCTGLKAVSYPDTRHLIKGSTV